MRRRLTFVSSAVALLLVFVLPAATVSAATYTYQVKANQCSASGGDYGYGELYFKVRLQEWSQVANKFTFAAKIQHKNLGGSRWYTDWNYGTFVYTFPANGSDYWYTRWWDYDPDDLAWHRIRVVLKVWRGGTLLASKVLVGKTC